MTHTRLFAVSVLPPVVDRLAPALGNLESTHQAPAALSAIGALARLLITGRDGKVT
jgi:hypothetical protein